MTFPSSHLPPGLHVGDHIVTNERYAKVYVRSPAGRKGVITAGRHWGTEAWVHLEGSKNPQVLDCRLFDRA